MLRDREGRLEATMEDAIRYELVLGTRGRSGEQFDAWQAVYSPVGSDGYPAQIFDPRTGAIDRKVAEYWKERFDLVHRIESDWKTLGPLLAGKLRIRSGTADSFYLERAVRLAQGFLEGTKEEGKGPYYAGTIEFNPDFGHGAAAAGLPPSLAGQSGHERVMKEMVEWMLKSAPAGADLKSWR
jgi:hypothetical protein